MILGIFTDGGTTTWENDDGEWATQTGISIVGALFAVTLLMILFTDRYPPFALD